jgi:hypothetical protein
MQFRPPPPTAGQRPASSQRPSPSDPPRRHLRRGRLPDPHRRHPKRHACLRNLVIGVLSRAGPVNVAAGLRRHARDPADPSPPSGSASDEPHITTGRQSPGVPGPLCVEPDLQALGHVPGTIEVLQQLRVSLAVIELARAWSFWSLFLGLPREALDLAPNLRWLVVVITAQRWCARVTYSPTSSTR